MNILVTGGCGFIGRHLVEALVRDGHGVVVLDSLSHGSDYDATVGLGASVIIGDTTDSKLLGWLADGTDLIYHLAAETHVDRSLIAASPFLDSNVLGTAAVLEAARQTGQRVVAVSTDEVYGSVPAPHASLETDTLDPRSPYSASKAAADMLALAWHASYGTDVVITRCTNNYGPGQDDEKAIPTWMRALREGRPIPIYGNGQHERDWLYVTDHVAALILLAELGEPGEIYNIGAGRPIPNLDVVDSLIDLAGGGEWESVADRPGHDSRYCVDTTKIAGLGWEPIIPLTIGLAHTWDRA